MPRPIWKGHIAFGLVNVPVVLHSAEHRADLSFRLIDSRNSARVRYERVNEETGEEVPWDAIVKGYEFEDGNYVLLSDEELERASVKMTRAIEIERFVDLSQINIRYFDKPYLLVPGKNGEKGYVLLREAIAESGRAGIANVVIRSRQYLAALLVDGDALVLELLRYQQELRKLDDFELPGRDLRKQKVSKKEMELASQLIDGMTADWDPTQHRDEYRQVLMKLIEKKIKTGKTEEIDVEPEEAEAEPKTINFMDALKESVACKSSRKSAKRPPRKRKAAGWHVPSGACPFARTLSNPARSTLPANPARTAHEMPIPVPRTAIRPASARRSEVAACRASPLRREDYGTARTSQRGGRGTRRVELLLLVPQSKSPSRSKQRMLNRPPQPAPLPAANKRRRWSQASS